MDLCGRSIIGEGSEPRANERDLAKKRADRVVQESACPVQQWNEAEAADADQRHVTEDRTARAMTRRPRDEK
jgi:hypothetical protein